MQGHTHRDGGHSHGGSTGSAGSHKHDGKSDTDGSHSHDVETGSGYNRKKRNHIHQPLFQYQKVGKQRDDYAIFVCTEVSFDDIKLDSAGSHYHNLYISSAGSHSHNFTTASASASLGEPTTLSYGTPRCGDETRPANVALLFCIKY